MTYKLTKPFKNWQVGDELQQFEFNRLPAEFKKYAKLVVPVEKQKAISKIMKNVKKTSDDDTVDK